MRKLLAMLCVVMLAGCGGDTEVSVPVTPTTPVAANVIVVTPANFGAEIAGHKGYALVDFWAEWCGPCRAVAPVVAELSSEFAGRIKFAKLNVDQGGDLPEKYKIESIPALILFKDGKEIDRVIGAEPKAKLKSWLETKTK